MFKHKVFSKAGILFLILFFCLSVSAKADPTDSLLNVIKTAKADSSKVRAASVLTRVIYKRLPDSCISISRKWLPLAITCKMPKSEANFYANMAQAYKIKGILDSALALHLKGLKIREVIDDKQNIPDSYNGIAQTYLLLNNYPQAINYFNKSLEGYIKIGDKYSQSSVLNNFGTLYQQKKEFEKARDYILRSMVIKKELGNEKGYFMGLMNLGNIYVDLKQFKTADSCIFKFIEFSEKKKDMISVMVGYINIGTSMNKQKKFKEGAEYFEKVIPFLPEINIIDYSRHAYQGIADSYIGLGNFKSGYEYYRKYKILEDSMLLNDNLKQIKEMDVKYQSEKKDKELVLKDAEITKQEAESAKQQAQRNVFIVGFGLAALLALFIFRSYRQKQKDNTVIKKQKAEVEEQKHIIEEKQKEIVDSITYAKRLQEAILPSQADLKKNLPESFLLYLPKDIVAGDFYWMERIGDVVFIAAADSTGHGVPGAMVSVVCSNALNRAVLEFHIADPGKILDKARELVIQTFEKSGEEVKDGMDISLAAVNLKTRMISWSGAHNPLWYQHNDQIIDVSANKQPIGKSEHYVPFKTHELELNKGDSVYLFTDGYADQFGGPKEKKFKYAPFKDLLLATSKLTPQDQKNELIKSFAAWKGELEQVDDVCVIGIRL